MKMAEAVEILDVVVVSIQDSSSMPMLYFLRFNSS